MGTLAPFYRNKKCATNQWGLNFPLIWDPQLNIRYKDGPNQYLSIALMNNESAELSICGSGMWRLADTCTIGGGYIWRGQNKKHNWAQIYKNFATLYMIGCALGRWELEQWQEYEEYTPFEWSLPLPLSSSSRSSSSHIFNDRLLWLLALCL